MNNSSTPVSSPATNVTSSSSNAGLAVGLTFFFLLLLIVPGLIVYKFHSKIRKVYFRQRRTQKKEDLTEATQEAFHTYTSMQREQSVAQTPIYENLTRSTDYSQAATQADQSRSLSEPEEDVYLQCDVADDAIYSNDPNCNLALQDCQEEDVYITPDS